MENRVLKFRAFKDGKMYPVHTLDMYEHQKGKLAGFTHPNEKECIDLEGAVFMQWTGLKDKNMVNIYEGDIFRIEEEDDEVDRVFYVVIVWVKEWTMFCSLLMEQEYKEYLRIGIKALDEPMFWTYTLEDTDSRKHFLCGNIHQHPHLLNQTS